MCSHSCTTLRRLDTQGGGLRKYTGWCTTDFTARGYIQVGAKIPSIELDYGFPPAKVNIAERAAGKKIILLGLPGAFTPT